MADIPTSSMADIAFLLIIFFMVTAVFSATKGLEFKLPKEDQDAPPETEDAVFIKVFSDSTIAVDCKPMQHNEILDYLEPKLTRNPEKPVILYTDTDAPYSGMIAVYDVLTLAKETRGFKVKNISVPTQSEIREYIVLFGVNPFEQTCQ
jgi:biopolymer transport protein ExbD